MVLFWSNSNSSRFIKVFYKKKKNKFTKQYCGTILEWRKIYGSSIFVHLRKQIVQPVKEGKSGVTLPNSISFLSTKQNSSQDRFI